MIFLVTKFAFCGCLLSNIFKRLPTVPFFFFGVNFSHSSWIIFLFLFSVFCEEACVCKFSLVGGGWVDFWAGCVKKFLKFSFCMFAFFCKFVSFLLFLFVDIVGSLNFVHFVSLKVPFSCLVLSSHFLMLDVLLNLWLLASGGYFLVLF